MSNSHSPPTLSLAELEENTMVGLGKEFASMEQSKLQGKQICSDYYCHLIFLCPFIIATNNVKAMLNSIVFQSINNLNDLRNYIALKFEGWIFFTMLSIGTFILLDKLLFFPDIFIIVLEIGASHILRMVYHANNSQKHIDDIKNTLNTEPYNYLKTSNQIFNFCKSLKDFIAFMKKIQDGLCSKDYFINFKSTFIYI